MEQLDESNVKVQQTLDDIPTVWVSRDHILPAVAHLHHSVSQPFTTLLDLTAIDERERVHRDGQPIADFTVVYHLFSFERNQDIRLKVPLQEESTSIPTATGVWASSNWYEREVYDMFGITFEGHPALRRILMPQTWEGHPLRKEHHARATERGPFSTTPEKEDR